MVAKLFLPKILAQTSLAQNRLNARAESKVNIPDSYLQHLQEKHAA